MDADQLRRWCVKRQNNACAFCTRPGDLRIDRVLPWSLGGAVVLANSIAVCPSCRDQPDFIAVPLSWMTETWDPDPDGFYTWRRFGAWTLRFAPERLALCHDRSPSYVYIMHDRVHEPDWYEHYHRKAWSDATFGLAAGLAFLRSIVRAPACASTAIPSPA